MPLKPVVFVPGLPASELRRRSSQKKVFPPSLKDLGDSAKKEIIRLLSGAGDPEDDVVAGEPIRGVLAVTKQAQSLYDVLRSYDYTTQDGEVLAPVGWDWRKGVDDHVVQKTLADTIARLARDHGRKVVVIAHSTGGLVLRALLEAKPRVADDIEQVLAFGVPWAGTLKAVRYLVRGERFGLIIVGKTIRGFDADEARSVMRRCQAAYDLFPPDPGKTDLRGMNLVVDANGQQVGLLVDTSWLPSSADGEAARALAVLADQRLGQRKAAIELDGAETPPITNVVGWGVTTDTGSVLVDGTLSFAPETKEGDGTVASASVAWLRGNRVRTFFLPIGVYASAIVPEKHPRIWDAPAARAIFDQVLIDAERRPFVAAASDGDAAVKGRKPFTVRLSASDVDGRPLPNVKVVFSTFPGRPQTTFANGATRHEIVLDRTGVTPNVGSGFFRFRADVTWGGGSVSERRELPLLVHA